MRMHTSHAGFSRTLRSSDVKKLWQSLTENGAAASAEEACTAEKANTFEELFGDASDSDSGGSALPRKERGMEGDTSADGDATSMPVGTHTALNPYAQSPADATLSQIAGA